MYKISPAFYRYPAETAAVGFMLAAFGELEFSFCRNAQNAIGNENKSNSVLCALYKLKNTSSRFSVADVLMKPFFEKYDLSKEYDLSYQALKHCCKIRNQYAHCNWADDEIGGLFFADLQDTQWPNLVHSYRHIDVNLTSAQLAFFGYTHEWLTYLDIELAIRSGRLKRQSWPIPVKHEPPPLHNPPEEHVPPFLSEAHREMHLAKARAAAVGAPTPTPKQQELDKARAEKKAQKKARRQSAVNGDPQQKTAEPRSE